MSQNPSDEASAAPEGSGAGGEGHVPTPAALPDGATAESVLEVAEFNSRLSAHIEAHALEFEYVVGDVSDCTEARSGHTYFDLTGADAAIDCALWSYRADTVTATPEEGLHVAVSGDISFYEERGSLTLIVDDVVPIGESEYAQARAETREQLAAEGLLAADRKQPLPEAPHRIGLVTSADSDARSDAVRSIRERHPGVDIVVHDAAVQGEDALPSLMTAIESLDAEPEVDLLVVTRGGGANATLRVFDALALCRAVARTETPVVVGIGHEEDRPLLDQVADRRVMTPTHVGEVVPDRDARLDKLRDLDDRLRTARDRAAAERLTDCRDRLDGAYTEFAGADVQRRAGSLTEHYRRLVRSRLADRSERLDRAHETRVTALRNDLDAALDQRKRTIAHEAEKAELVDEAASTIRRQRVLIAALGLLVLVLTAYIIYI